MDGIDLVTLRFRLGTHCLRTDKSQHTSWRNEEDPDTGCVCCSDDADETLAHMLLDCKAHEQARKEAMEKLTPAARDWLDQGAVKQDKAARHLVRTAGGQVSKSDIETLKSLLGNIWEVRTAKEEELQEAEEDDTSDSDSSSGDENLPSDEEPTANSILNYFSRTPVNPSTNPARADLSTPQPQQIRRGAVTNPPSPPVSLPTGPANTTVDTSISLFNTSPPHSSSTLNIPNPPLTKNTPVTESRPLFGVVESMTKVTDTF